MVNLPSSTEGASATSVNNYIVVSNKEPCTLRELESMAVRLATRMHQLTGTSKSACFVRALKHLRAKYNMVRLFYY